jgi:curved DNA-binding protein CbpA
MDPILEKITKARWPRGAVSWSVTELLAWLREVEPIADTRAKFDWLEIPPTASSTAIQEAYHRVARTRHPDLFRRRIEPALMDRLVRMYARITSAYAELKDPEKCGAYLRELRGPRQPTVPPPGGPPPRMARPLNAVVPPMRSEISSPTRIPKPPTYPPPPGIAPRPRSPTPAAPVAVPPVPGTSERPITRVAAPPPGAVDPAHAMNPRALSFYRRAEGVLRTGDRAAAMLQLKMAIAADPRSTFLRAALAELAKAH